MTANIYLPPVITVPSTLEITAISKSFPMIVVTTMNSDQENVYSQNQVVSFTVPYTWGMWQVNGLKGIILDVTNNIITVAIDSTQFDSFSNPNDGTVASLAPSGSRNLEYNNDTALHAPFRNLNNAGN